MLYRAGPTGHGLGQAYDDKGPWCALDRGVLKGGWGVGVPKTTAGWPQIMAIT